MQQLDEAALDELLTRGVTEIIGGDELRERLRSGETLRIKLGIDPTSPNLHIGRAITLLKLQDFERAGHQIVFIVGDFTGVIGDTSDKESERPMLSRETILENYRTYFDQAGKIIDLERAELHRNSEWLESLTYREIGEHADQFSVADFIARDNIKRRLDAGKRVSLREVLYPLMQGYDSVVVRADLEVGGTDQRFNMLAGRTLQSFAGQRTQAVMMNPLIPGLDGRKMSSSWGNTINITDSPEDMYGKVMSLRDELIADYFLLCTRVSLQDASRIHDGLRTGDMHPKDAKMQLAHELVRMYHSTTEADRAQEVFTRTFQQGQVPDEVPETSAVCGELLGDVALRAGVVASKSEWRRLVEGGGVTQMSAASDLQVHDAAAVVDVSAVYRIGKRRFLNVVIS